MWLIGDSFLDRRWEYMSYDLSKPLVIGISSRALFNLEQENKIFEEQGVEA